MTFKELLQKHTIIKCLLMCVSLFGSIAWVHQLLSPFMKVLLALGFAAVLYDIVRRRFFLKDPAFWLLVAFAASYCVSAFVNGGGQSGRAVRDMLYMVLLFCLLFAGQKESDADLERRERIVLAKAALVMMLVMVAACFAAYLALSPSTYVTADGTVGYIGELDGRLAGLVHMNVIGAVSAMTVILCTGMLVLGTGGLWRIVCAAAVALSTATLVLSRSRTSILALAITFVCVLARYVIWAKMSPTSRLAAKKAAYSILTLAVGGVIAFVVYSAAKGTLAAAVSNAARYGDSLLTGRVSIWAEGLRLFAEHPFLGITVQNFAATAIVPIEYTWSGGGIHSLYVGVPVGSGLAGSALLTVFTVYCAVSGRRARRMAAAAGEDVLRAKYDGSWHLAGVMICFLLAQGFAESYLLFSLSFFAVIFWLCMGIRRRSSR